MDGRAPEQERRDEGAAVPEFVMVSLLVLALFVVVFQVGLALHTRNVLVSVAADGARYAANADVRLPQDRGDVLRRVQDGIATAFTPAYAAQADVQVQPAPGDPAVVRVQITAPFPLAFLPAGPLELTVRGHAFEEGRPGGGPAPGAGP